MARRRSKSWYISRLVRANGIVKDEVVNVSGGTGSADSDVAAIAQLRREADSDETQIQEIGSQVRRAQAAIDSDYALFNTKFALLSGLTDSDLSTVAKLRADVDSDSTKVQTLSSTVGNSVTSSQIDSDRNSGHSARVFRINSTSELDTLNQNNGLGTRVGVARVGDIAYIANPFKAYVLTNIYANAGSTYTATGFRVQTGNGTVTRMTFDIIPSGQTAAGNFAVGMQISNRSYARDVRTITAVTSTYLDFTPSDAGYPPGWDNEYVYTLAAAQTTWQKFSFDSEHVAAIIQEAGVGGFDSDQIVAIINENSTS